MLTEKIHNQTRQNRLTSFTPVYRAVLQRQCACGNQTMGGGQCTECQKNKMGVGGQPLQAKLAISEPGDVYEQEADRVAEQVMRMSPADVSRKQNGSRAQPLVQRRASSGAAGLTEVPPVVHEVLRSPGQPLGPAARAFFEPRFGYDFSQVRVHTDAKAAESARAVNALGYTVGRDVVFGSGAFVPETNKGQYLLAHELTHVLQQRGSGSATVSSISDSEGMAEREAHRFAFQVRQGVSNLNKPTTAPLMLARGEKWDALWGVGPWDAYKAKRLADKALAKAADTGMPGLHNGAADAWRHCYWNCSMTAEIGADQAKTIADNHEKHGKGPASENTMDFHNNEQGRLCGGKDCDKCCQNSLDTGSLRVLDGKGVVIPSTATKRAGKPSTGSGAYSY